MYYNRLTKTMCTENAPSQNKINILYNTVLGRVLLKLVFSTMWFSYLAGIYYNSILSKSKLKKFLHSNNLIQHEKNLNKYNSFNDFFTRKENRKFTCKEGVLVSPCDSLLSAYTITEDLALNIKGGIYSLQTLLKNSSLAEKYIGGTCLIYRLTLTDYHRYIFTQSGKITSYNKIKGCLHTVRPLNGGKNNYFENTRTATQMSTEQFGDIVQVEIGAMLVGKIVNHKTAGEFEIFDEKGYFELGGSTIVQLFKKGNVTMCEDILQMSAKSTECKVLMGEKIGNAYKVKYIF